MEIEKYNLFQFLNAGKARRMEVIIYENEISSTFKTFNINAFINIDGYFRFCSNRNYYGKCISKFVYPKF